jgi:hypothetical protein
MVTTGGLILAGDLLPPHRHFTGLFDFGHILAFERSLVAHFRGDDRGSIEINHLVDIGHNAVLHQIFNDLDGTGF